MKEIEGDKNRWKNIPCSWIGKKSIVKITILLKAIYRLHVIPVKLPKVLFADLEKNLKICMVTQMTLNSQSNLRKKNIAGGIRLPDFRLYHNMIVIKTVWYWHKDRPIDQRNRIEITEINPHTCSHLIYDRGSKKIQWRKESHFKKWCWKNWTIYF